MTIVLKRDILRTGNWRILVTGERPHADREPPWQVAGLARMPYAHYH